MMNEFNPDGKDIRFIDSHILGIDRKNRIITQQQNLD